MTKHIIDCNNVQDSARIVQEDYKARTGHKLKRSALLEGLAAAMKYENKKVMDAAAKNNTPVEPTSAPLTTLTPFEMLNTTGDQLSEKQVKALKDANFYDWGASDDYTDYEFNVTYLTEKETGGDHHSFDLHFTIDWDDKNIYMALGTNVGCGWNDYIQVNLTSNKPWGEAVTDAIAEKTKENKDDEYVLLATKYSKAHDEIVKAATDAYNALMLNTTSDAQSATNSNTFFIGSHTYKSSNDYNEYQPVIIVGKTHGEVIDAINKDALENLLLSDAANKLPVIINEFETSFAKADNDLLQTKTKNCQNPKDAAQAIINDAKLANLTLETLIQEDLIQGQCSIKEASVSLA
ncbi:hypothetical protein VCHA53O466_40439 [Vibrio chagasii]|nr:hypothetical protein VCHA53O466_40439 [Vibrio chagasii]